ncbi:carbohydrate-binding family 9-like protein [Candidatus Calescamantes bacterium]|nr:carbohydrate-binding family 9-like protein [Candidatus Calescamantes bacterium]
MDKEKVFFVWLIIGVSLINLGFIKIFRPPTPEKKDKKPYLCHKAKSEITIDGKLEEEAWKSAEVIDTFYILRKSPKDKLRESQSKTVARLLWDDEFLYIGIEAEDKDIWSTIKEHDGKLWTEDVLELFIKPDEDKFAYYEFEFSPRNVVLDLFYPRRGARSFVFAKGFESNLKSRVEVCGTLDNWKDKDEKWILEAAIPFIAFKEAIHLPQVGDEWKFAVCRYDYSVYLPSDYSKGVELSTSTPFSGYSFDRYEDYSPLKFVE